MHVHFALFVSGLSFVISSKSICFVRLTDNFHLLHFALFCLKDLGNCSQNLTEVFSSFYCVFCFHPSNKSQRVHVLALALPSSHVTGELS